MDPAEKVDLIKDWGWFRMLRFLITCTLGALAFIFAMVGSVWTSLFLVSVTYKRMPLPLPSLTSVPEPCLSVVREQDYLITNHVPEWWKTPMEPGKHLFSDLTVAQVPPYGILSVLSIMNVALPSAALLSFRTPNHPPLLNLSSHRIMNAIKST